MSRIHIIIDNKNPEIQPDIDKILEKFQAKQIDDFEDRIPDGSFENRIQIFVKFQNARKGRLGYRFIAFAPKTNYFGASPRSFHLKCKHLLKNSSPKDFQLIKGKL